MCVNMHGRRPSAENAHDRDNRETESLLDPDRPHQCHRTPSSAFSSRAIRGTRTKRLMAARPTSSRNRAIFISRRRPYGVPIRPRTLPTRIAVFTMPVSATSATATIAHPGKSQQRRPHDRELRPACGSHCPENQRGQRNQAAEPQAARQQMNRLVDRVGNADPILADHGMADPAEACQRESRQSHAVAGPHRSNRADHDQQSGGKQVPSPDPSEAGLKENRRDCRPIKRRRRPIRPSCRR